MLRSFHCAQSWTDSNAFSSTLTRVSASAAADALGARSVASQTSPTYMVLRTSLRPGGTAAGSAGAPTTSARAGRPSTADDETS